jgi:CRP-like cAMP-binding protein
MAPVQIEHFLAQLPQFKELGRVGIARIAAAATERIFPRRTIIFRRGGLCAGLHVVVSGQVKLSVHTARGDETLVDLVSSGMSIGEEAIFLGKSHFVTAETVTETRVIYLTTRAVMEEIRQNHHFSRCLLSVLSRRLYERTRDLESFTLRSGTERVVTYLLHHEPEAKFNGTRLIMLSAAKGLIAARLNLTKEHFSRILHELHAAGLIQVNGRSVCILDTGRLQAHGAE